MNDPAKSLYLSSQPEEIWDVLPAVRDLLQEHLFLAQRSAETIRHALRALRGIEVDVFTVEAALEALRVEGEVLA